MNQSQAGYLKGKPSSTLIEGYLQSNAYVVSGFYGKKR
jgi:hypothetical protein